MNIYEKQRLHEICESVKNDFLYSTLSTIEEAGGYANELDILETKKFLQETTSKIERMLIQEGLFDYGKQLITEAAEKSYMDKIAAGAAGGAAGYATAQYGPQAAEAAKGAYNQAAGAVKGAYNQVSDAAQGMYNQAAGAVKGAVDNTVNDIQQFAGEKVGELAISNPSLATKIAKHLPESWKNDADYTSGMTHGMYNQTAEAVNQNIVEPVKGAYNQAAEAVNQNIVEPVKDAAGAVADYGQQVVAPVAQHAGHVAGQYIDQAGQALQQYANQAAQHLAQ